ncbi:MAG TPA: sugar kinase [Planctomycetota bacterium]|nr:sugar kinase [Planctomycetota bacterium]
MKHIPTDKKVVVFGELMMRLSTKRHERIVQAREFDVSYSGAEANLACALAGWGVQSAVVSSVPDNAVGDACIAYMRQFGVDLEHVKRNGFRLGIYYVETGAGHRPSSFLYNRKGSSITELGPDDFDWDRILEGKHWFHVTGITPALADNVAEIATQACAAAQAKGLTVSCDLNFRRKLWSPEKARAVMPGLLEHVDVLFTNEEEAAVVFGIEARGSDVGAGRLNPRGYEDVATQLAERFTLDVVSITLRESHSASENTWSGMLYHGKRFYTSQKFRLQPIVDRVGGGDAFSAGVVYGLLTGQDLQETVEFSAAASCLKHTVHGDVTLVSFQEVLTLLEGGGSGRIQR